MPRNYLDEFSQEENPVQQDFLLRRAFTQQTGNFATKDPKGYAKFRSQYVKDEGSRLSTYGGPAKPVRQRPSPDATGDWEYAPGVSPPSQQEAPPPQQLGRPGQDGRGPLNVPLSQLRSSALATQLTRSQAAGPGVNARNLQPIPGAQEVQYAGQYGDTNVFAADAKTPEGEPVRRFSDYENLATLRGGQPAPIPAGKQALTNTGVTPAQGQQPELTPEEQFIKNTTMSDGTRVYGGSFGGQSFADPQGFTARGIRNAQGEQVGVATISGSQALTEARRAAIQRGDIAAYENSMLTPQERYERDLLKNAAREDPVKTLATLGATRVAEARSQYQTLKDARNASYQEARLSQGDQRNMQRQKAGAMKAAQDAINGYGDMLPADARSIATMIVAAELERGNYQGNPASIAAMAVQRAQNELASDREPSEIIQSLLAELNTGNPQQPEPGADEEALSFAF